MNLGDRIRIYEFVLNSNLDRISSGQWRDINMVPYSLDFIDEMILYFEKNEEYEKCQILKNFKELRFNHELRYTWYEE